MNNNLSKISRNITIIIVTFKSEDIIEECLNNLGKQNKIIIIENSSNKQLRYKIKKLYKNVNFIINKTNLGISKSWNIGIKKTKTKYALIMNPDSFPEKNCIKELYLTAEKKKNSSIIFPLNTDKKGRISDEFGIFTSNGMNKCKIKNGLNKIDWCNGNLMLLNKDSLNEIGLFDEKFFFSGEETDLCKRIIDNNKENYLNSKAKNIHLGSKSINHEYDNRYNFFLNWHKSWSTFFFYKKNFSVNIALKKTFFNLLYSTVKSIFFLLSFNKKKLLNHVAIILGTLTSYLGFKSYYRIKY
jgi:GT2 family glycosyltransferase